MAQSLVPNRISTPSAVRAQDALFCAGKNTGRRRSGRRGSGEAPELPLHLAHPGEIGGDVVIAAPLARRHVESAARGCFGGTRAAEMDDRGEILLLLRTRPRIRPARENGRDVAVEIDRGEL